MKSIAMILPKPLASLAGLVLLLSAALVSADNTGPFVSGGYLGGGITENGTG